MKFRLIGVALALAAGSAFAQQYPTKSVTMLVPFAAGGPTDTVARVVAQSMAKPLGQTVIVENKPSADPAAMTPEKVAERLQPVGKVEFGAPQAAPGARSGEDIVKAVCGACHTAGVAGAPKIGDKAQWGPRIKQGQQQLVANAIKGKGAMPPKGGAADLTDAELARAIVFMANQSGQNLKEPAAAKPAAAAKK